MTEKLTVPAFAESMAMFLGPEHAALAAGLAAHVEMYGDFLDGPKADADRRRRYA